MVDMWTGHCSPALATDTLLTWRWQRLNLMSSAHELCVTQLNNGLSTQLLRARTFCLTILKDHACWWCRNVWQATSTVQLYGICPLRWTPGDVPYSCLVHPAGAVPHFLWYIHLDTSVIQTELQPSKYTCWLSTMNCLRWSQRGDS